MFPSRGSDNDEGSRMKQRTVGGLVLVALAVIIVPLILDFRKDYNHVIRGTNIPPKPDDFRVEVVPLKPPEETLPSPESLADSKADIDESHAPEAGPESEVEPASAPPAPAPVEKQPVEKKPAAEKPVAKPEAPKPAATPEAKKPAAATVEKKPAPATQTSTPAASADENAWVIQVGSFSNVKNAANLRDQLQKKGYEAFIDDVRVDDRTIHRVRIGPLDKKAAANAVRDKLAIEMKLDARVFSYP